MQPVILRRLALAAVAAAGIVAASAPPAHATFPGKDGRIAVVTWSPLGPFGAGLPTKVVSTNPDGTGLRTQSVAPNKRYQQAGYEQTTGNGAATGLDYSPDGTRLVVSRGFGYDVPRLVETVFGYAAGPINYTIRTYQPGEGLPATRNTASWTPDGKLLFAGGHFAGDSSTTVTLRDTPWKPLRTLLTSEEARDAAISPDATKLAIATNDGLWLANPDGTEKRLLSPGRVETIDWSPDSTRLVLGSGASTIEIVAVADGSRTTFPLSGFRPVWSPTGKQLAFISENEQQQQVRVADVDGKNERTVRTWQSASQTEPQFGVGLSWQALR